LVGDIINLKKVPSTRTRHGIELRRKLSVLTGASENELFPASLYTPEFLAKPKKLEILAEASTSLLTSQPDILSLPLAPDEAMMRKEDEQMSVEKKAVLDEVLSTLNRQQRFVINEKFLKGRTSEEVGKDLKVGKTRVLQIEAKAFRLLRHPVRTRKLATIIEI
jgi:RNA polymerase sigma factor (sigma-70 family)